MTKRWGLLVAVAALQVGGCASAHDADAVAHSVQATGVRSAASTTGLPAVVALDRIPKKHGGLNVDADRAAIGYIGPDRTMIVAAPMGAGGSGGDLDVGLFRVGGNEPVFVSDLSLNGGVRRITIDGGRLIVATAAYRGSDRLCCPSGTRIWTYGMVHGHPVLLQSNVTWASAAVPAPPAAAVAKIAPAAADTAPSAKPAPKPKVTARVTPMPTRRVATTGTRDTTPPVVPARSVAGGADCTPTSIYSIASDGSTIDTADGSVFRVAAPDQPRSKQWQRGEGVTVCGNWIVNQDEQGQRVNVTAAEE
ncbi:MAG: hypothetical protein KGM44_06210 [bacterium]|nr:hypothetical protein [bacterium]